MKKWISPIPQTIHFIWLGSDPRLFSEIFFKIIYSKYGNI